MQAVSVPSTSSVSDVNVDYTLQLDSGVSTSSSNLFYIDGASTFTSLYIGSGIAVDLGQFSAATLSGSGNIFGDNDPNVTLPSFTNDGTLDISGTIAVELDNNAHLVVSSGERLDVEGTFSGLGASDVTIAAGAELVINSQGGGIFGRDSAMVSAVSSQGTLKLFTPTTTILGATTLGGTVLVQGDALNGLGNGTPAPRAIGSTYVATLDLRSATLSAPITNLTLAQDAQIRFGTGPTTIGRLVVAGSATALVPLDVVNFDGTVTVTGDGSGASNQAAISMAEFAGGNTIDFTVAATDGGATLQQQIVLDAGTTLRNDAKMTIGGQGTAATTLGATSAATGSTFVNGAAGQLTIAAGAALSVAAIQNAGAITVAGNTTVMQSLSNTGSIDITSGTLALEASVMGAGTITVENGATLAIDAASSQGTVALRGGSTLRLSQPSTFASTIQSPSAGAKIDLAGIIATSATVSNGSIAVTSASGTVNIAETGLTNGVALAISSDGTGGSLLSVPVPVAGAPAAAMTYPVIYRFFDGVHGTQFLTASLSETQSLQATRSDLVYEGVGLNAVDPAVDSTAAPVYRFFDTKFGTHFYTSSTTERDAVSAARSDLKYEGVGFYEHATAQSGDAAVYRFFDANFGTHFYTSSTAERASIIATRPDLVSEGVGFYAPTA